MTMELRTFGRSGLRLSILGFGCGAVGGLMVRGAPADQERAVARGLEVGINYFDTAAMYGHGESEKNLGRVLAKLKPQGVVVGTKVRLPVEDRGRVERMLAHANLILTARQDGKLVGFARSLTDFCFCCYLSDLAVDKACQGQGIGKRLIEETRSAAGGPMSTTLLLSAPTAMSFYQGIKMPHADNCFVYRRQK